MTLCDICGMHDVTMTITPRRAEPERLQEINAAEMLGELIGRYRDAWPAVCKHLGLIEADISFVSLTAVLDLLVEQAGGKAWA